MFRAWTTALILTLSGMSLAAFGTPAVSHDTVMNDPGSGGGGGGGNGGGSGGRGGGGSPGDNGDRLSL